MFQRFSLSLHRKFSQRLLEAIPDTEIYQYLKKDVEVFPESYIKIDKFRPMPPNQQYYLFFDGCSKGNPGPVRLNSL